MSVIEVDTADLRAGGGKVSPKKSPLQVRTNAPLLSAEVLKERLPAAAADLNCLPPGEDGDLVAAGSDVGGGRPAAGRGQRAQGGAPRALSLAASQQLSLQHELSRPSCR